MAVKPPPKQRYVLLTDPWEIESVQRHLAGHAQLEDIVGTCTENGEYWGTAKSVAQFREKDAVTFDMPDGHRSKSKVRH